MEGRLNTNSLKVENKSLLCADCGEKFLFDAGEQAFFWSKGLSEPRRQKRKATLVPDGRLQP